MPPGSGSGKKMLRGRRTLLDIKASGRLEERAIIIPGSPETGSNDRLDIGDNVLGEAVLAPSALQMILPPAQVGSQPSRSEFTSNELKRPKLPG